MKRLAILTLFILAISLMAVSAAQVTVSQSFSVTSPTFGSSSQKASDPNHDTSSLRDVYVDSNGVITLTNTGAGSITLTGIKLVSSPQSFSSTDINLSIVGGPVTIGAGAGATVTLNARVTEKLDAVDSNLRETAFQVATISFVNSSNTEVSDQFPLYMQRKNQLRFKNIDVTVTRPTGGRDKTSISDSSDDINDVKPGDNLDVDLEAENRYSNSEDVSIDTDVRVSIDTSDYNDDDDDSLGDISADDKDSTSFSFQVDDDAEDDTGDASFEADGNDEFGARHGEKITVSFEIKRESHDIQVQRIAPSPTTIDCADTSVQIAVDILNLGKRDEKDVAVELSSKALNYDKRISNIQLDSDDEDTEVFDVNFPKNLQSGIYALEVQTFYDGSRLSNTEVGQIESVCGKTAGTITTETKGSLTLSQSSTSLKRGGTASVGVQVTNIENTIKPFTVRLTGAEDFAEPVTPKTLTLNPGQTTTVFFNLKGKSGAEDGTYTAQVVLESGAQVVKSETLTVKVEGESKTTGTTGTGFGGVSSTSLWVVADVVLIGLAIAFVWLIFGGKKKPTPI